MATEKRGYKHITRQQEFALGKFMEPLIKRGSGEYIEYTADWTDEKVAARSGLGVAPDQVARFRIAVFGKFSPKAGTTFLERFAALEERVRLLEEAATRPAERSDTLHRIITNGPMSRQS